MIETSLVEGRIILTYVSGESETAGFIAGVCQKAVDLIEENWGLGLPPDCRIFVMTSWWGFVFQSAPWPWKILLVASLPFWALRARRTWPYSAAWTQRYGGRVAIGVKPPRLLEKSQFDVGLRVFVEEKDIRVNVERVTCHELMHACSAHLRLPTWLNEGLATVTVDRLAGKPTIRVETLAMLRDYQPKTTPPTYREMSRMDLEAIAYHGVRGYWIVRYLEERCPGFLKRMLSARKDEDELDQAMASRLNLEVESLWHEIDGCVLDHFASLSQNQSVSAENPPGTGT